MNVWIDAHWELIAKLKTIDAYRAMLLAIPALVQATMTVYLVHLAPDFTIIHAKVAPYNIITMLELQLAKNATTVAIHVPDPRYQNANPVPVSFIWKETKYAFHAVMMMKNISAVSMIMFSRKNYS